MRFIPLAVLVVIVFLLGCVYVARQGSYSRSDSITGSNKVMKMEVKP